MIDTQTRCDEFGLNMPEGCPHLADALLALGFTDWTYANDEQPSMGIQLAPATETQTGTPKCSTEPASRTGSLVTPC